MKHRSVLAVLLLNIITLSLYQFYWYYVTKVEMNAVNGQKHRVPGYIWFFISPISFWWWYRFCEAITITTKNKTSTLFLFLLPFVLSAVLFVIGLISGYYSTAELEGWSIVSFISLISVLYLPFLITTLYMQHKLNTVSK